MPNEPAATISVTRTVMVRLSGALSDDSVQSLRRILHDLIVDQGLSEVMVDLSEATQIEDDVMIVLEQAEAQIAAIGGHLELRAPVDAPRPLVETASDIPTFVPLEIRSAT